MSRFWFNAYYLLERPFAASGRWQVTEYGCSKCRKARIGCKRCRAFADARVKGFYWVDDSVCHFIPDED